MYISYGPTVHNMREHFAVVCTFTASPVLATCICVSGLHSLNSSCTVLLQLSVKSTPSGPSVSTGV